VKNRVLSEYVIETGHSLLSVHQNERGFDELGL
jgi:hypothetical protein